MEKEEEEEKTARWMTVQRKREWVTLVDYWVIRMPLSQGQPVRGLLGPCGEDGFVRQTRSGSLA